MRYPIRSPPPWSGKPALEPARTLDRPTCCFATLVGLCRETQPFICRYNTSASAATDAIEARFAFVNVPVLSTIQYVHLAQILDRRGVAEETTLRRRLPSPP